MSTELQVNANRKNAQKSSGPRTAEGKDASSQNAVKHGLCANRNVIRTESQEQYDTFRNEMIADIAPAGAMELMLAERIVSLSWRLKRAEHFQNSAMNAMIERDLIDSGYGWNDKIRRQAKDEAAEGNFDLVLGIIINRDFTRDKTLENLLAYEHRIESRLYKAIAELKKMQAIRQEQEKRNENKREKNEMVCTAHPTANNHEQELKSMSDTQYEEMIDEEIHVTDEGRKTIDEKKEKEEVSNKEVLLNEANPSLLKSFDVTGSASSEDYAAKQSQFGNDLVCTAHPTAKD